jgi:hypothetical protein
VPVPIAGGVAALFVVSLLFYTLAWGMRVDHRADYPGYAEVAADLTDGSLDAMYLRSPGYPVLLALTGSENVPSKTLFFVQMGLHFATIWLLLGLLWRTGLGAVGLLAFAALLCLPPFMEPAAYGLTEVLVAFLLTLGLSLWVSALSRNRLLLAVGSGLSFGYCAISHPTYWLVAAVPVVCLCGMIAAGFTSFVSFRRSVVIGGCLLLGACFVQGALLCHNGLKFNYWRPSTFAGYGLCLKTKAFLERLPASDGAVRQVLIDARNADLIQENSAHTAGSYIFRSGTLERLQEITGLDEMALSDYLARINLSLIGRAPSFYLSDVARSAAAFWFSSCGLQAMFGSPFLQGCWFVLGTALAAVFWFQLPLAVALAALSKNKVFSTVLRPVLAPFSSPVPVAAVVYWSALGIVLYATVVVAFLGSAEPRMRRAVEPLIILVCFIAINEMRKWWCLRPAVDPAGQQNRAA